MATKLTVNPSTGKLDVVQKPGGSDHSVQFNDSGAFGGDSNFTYDGSDVNINVEVTIGCTSSGGFPLSIHDSALSDQQFILEKYGGNQRYAGIAAARTRGATPCSQSVVFNGDRLGQFFFKASSGSLFGYRDIAGMRADISKIPEEVLPGIDWYTLSCGLSFYSTEDNAGDVSSPVMRLHDSGGLALGDSYYSTDPGTDNMIVEGKLGVGTSTLTYTFNVTGTFGVSGETYLGDGGTTDYVSFDDDGEMSLYGNARVKKENKLNILSFAPGASGATQTNIGNFTGWAFGINDDMITNFEVPEDWDTSTNLEIKIYWYIDEAYSANSGEVQWEVSWSALPSDESEAIDSPTHTGTIDYGDQDIPATAKYLTKTSSGTIASASLSAGDLIGLTIKRIALDDGNDPTSEPVIVHVEVKYTSDKLGESI